MLETISSNTKHTQTEQKYFNIYHWVCKKCEIAFRYLSDLDQHLQDKVLHSPTPKKSDNEDVRAKSFQKCKGEATLKPNKKVSNNVNPWSDDRAVPGPSGNVNPWSDDRAVPGPSGNVNPWSDDRAVPGPSGNVNPWSDDRAVPGPSGNVNPWSDDRAVPGPSGINEKDTGKNYFISIKKETLPLQAQFSLQVKKRDAPQKKLKGKDRLSLSKGKPNKTTESYILKEITDISSLPQASNNFEDDDIMILPCQNCKDNNCWGGMS